MNGTIGQFFHQFGITVAIAVLLSMFVSFTSIRCSRPNGDPDSERPLEQRTGARIGLV